jgi:hypothetical protein
MRGVTSTVACRIVAALAAVVLLGACNESEPVPDEVPAATWAKSVCGAVKPWTAEIQRLQGEAQRKITARSSAAQTKTELVALFDGMERSTTDALTAVAKAGVPEVKDGARIADQFVEALTAARDSFAMGRQAVDGLSTADQDAFDKGVVAAGEVMRKENSKADQAFGKISSAELDKAFEEVPECN